MILVLSLHGFYLDPGILDIFIQPMGLFANLNHATIGSVISSSGPTRYWLCYKTGNQFVYGAPVDGYPASSTSVPGGPYQDPHIDSHPTSIPAQSGDSHPNAGPWCHVTLPSHHPRVWLLDLFHLRFLAGWPVLLFSHGHHQYLPTPGT